MPEAEREAVPAGGACNPDRRRPKGCHAGGNAREARYQVEKCRGGAPGGARPTSLGAGRLVRRPGVPRWARQGAGASRTERLPALYPLVCEGTKKEASPVRFAVTTDRPGRRSVGFAEVVARIGAKRKCGDESLRISLSLNPGYVLFDSVK